MSTKFWLKKIQSCTQRPALVGLACALVWGQSSLAFADGGLAVLAIAAAEQTAVFRLGQNDPREVSVNDVLAEGRYRVRKVLKDRVVLQEAVADGRPGSEIWVYVADKQGHSRIRRVERVIVEDPPPMVMAPVSPEERTPR